MSALNREHAFLSIVLNMKDQQQALDISIVLNLPTRSTMPLTPTLYVNPNSLSARGVKSLRDQGRHSDADLIESKIASKPSCHWLGGWTVDPAKEVDNMLTAANGQLVVFVVYNIVKRDCGSFSSGGALTYPAYIEWVKKVAAGVKGRACWFILEPDSLGVLDCLSADELASRLSVMGQAVDLLRATKASVYIDVPVWAPVSKMVDRLFLAGIRRANGFAMNVAISRTTQTCVDYARQLQASNLIGNKPFLIDTSRSGNGPPPNGAEYCNPKMLRLGTPPTLKTGIPGCHAFLYVKTVGSSDGNCGRNEPEAGQWFEDYALRLAGKYGAP